MLPPPTKAEKQLSRSVRTQHVDFYGYIHFSLRTSANLSSLRRGDYWPGDSKNGRILGFRKNVEVRKNPRQPQ
jgi:hypothetical protein